MRTLLTQVNHMVLRSDTSLEVGTKKALGWRGLVTESGGPDVGESGTDAGRVTGVALRAA